MIPHSDTILRFSLPAYFVVLILVGGPYRVWMVRRRYGVDPLASEDPDPVTDFEEAYRNVLFLVVLLTCTAYAIDPGVNARFGGIAALDLPWIKAVGAAVLLASLVILVLGQRHLGESWRFGVDRSNPPPKLVTDGVYAFTRNPIYLGLLGSSWGLFLVLPDAITFAVANVTYVLLGVRIRIEEDFILRTHGSAFAEYRKRAPRWLVRLSRE